MIAQSQSIPRLIFLQTPRAPHVAPWQSYLFRIFVSWIYKYTSGIAAHAMLIAAITRKIIFSFPQCNAFVTSARLKCRYRYTLIAPGLTQSLSHRVHASPQFQLSPNIRHASITESQFLLYCIIHSWSPSDSESGKGAKGPLMLMLLSTDTAFQRDVSFIFLYNVQCIETILGKVN